MNDDRVINSEFDFFMIGGLKKEEKGMLLVIDVGNTNVVLGVYEKDQLLTSWRMTTALNQTSDEMGMFIYQLFRQRKIDIHSLEHVIISSVVPDFMHALVGAIKNYLHINPMIVGPGIKTGINIIMENPKELGADRLVNAVATVELYGAPAIVIDFGTATTYDVLSKEGAYIGGITSPGLRICADALYQRAAQLPRVAIKKPKNIIAKNTVDSIQSGLVYGAIGEVAYIIETIRKETKELNMKVIATGGLASLLDDGTGLFTEVNPNLTLEGLRILYEKNK